MIELKSPAEVDAMAAAGRVVAHVLSEVRAHAAPGVTPRQLDAMAAELIAAAGGKPTFLHYHPRSAPTPYSAVTCISVDDAVVHGLPTDQPLEPGSLLGVDLAVHVDGWCADAAFTAPIGDPRPGDADLVATAEAALDAGIAAMVVGARLGDVAHAIGRVVRAAGYGLLADHGGHGVGRAMHEGPHVPNEGKAGRGLRLQPGLVLALEPMLIAGGTDDYRHDPDGWTLRTVDGTHGAHVEHTVAVTADGPRVLTAGRPIG